MRKTRRRKKEKVKKKEDKKKKKKKGGAEHEEETRKTRITRKVETCLSVCKRSRNITPKSSNTIPI